MASPVAVGMGRFLHGGRVGSVTWTSFLVSFSSSLSERVFGSTATPPLAPPKGMSMTAVFHVISDARLHPA